MVKSETQKPVAPVTKTEQKPQFVIVPQTKVAFIGYILILIAMIIYLIQSPQSFLTFIPQIVGYIIIYILALYVINCTVLGKCNLYAWIMAYVIVVIAVFMILGLIYKLLSNK